EAIRADKAGESFDTAPRSAFGAPASEPKTTTGPQRHWPNPIDLGRDANAIQFACAAGAVLRDPNVDALLVLLGPQAGLAPVEAAQRLCDMVRTCGKPVLACWLWGTASSESLALLKDADIPNFHSPEAAIRAFGYLWQHG